MATITRLAVLGALVFALAGYIGWRYVELSVYRDLKRFFDSASMVLPVEAHYFSGMDSLEMESQAFELSGFRLPDALEDVKKQEGNLIAAVAEHKSNLPEWSKWDPFSPSAPKQLLEMRYGRLDAPLPPIEFVIDADAPVWFVLGAGPSRTTPILEPIEQENEIIRYTIAGPPYNTTNGLFSNGYLYADSLGRRLGYYDPFYPDNR